MMEVLENVFAWVCGQNPEHSWSPGGVLLPMCQRCTGLYAGAAVAGLLHFVLRPAFSKWFLNLHGLFLLIMVPFGFHWVEQGEVVRGATGALFGFGLVTFMILPLRECAGSAGAGGEVVTQDEGRERGALVYLGVAVALIWFMPLAGSAGNRSVGWGLSVLAVGGLIVLLGLSVRSTAAIAGRGLIRLAQKESGTRESGVLCRRELTDSGEITGERE